jgi:transglutaminase-like putative cysteine protease
MELNINHRTEYVYERTVHHSIQELRLTPQKNANQTVVNWKVNTPSKTHESVDAFGNESHVFVIDTTYMGMMIEARGEVHTRAIHVFEDHQQAVSPYYLLQQTPLSLPSAEMIDYFSTFKVNSWTPDALLKLALEIQKKVSYQQGITNANTTAAEAFALKCGVCQDHSHLMLGLARHFSLPARYVSGYFYAENQPDLASHAWVDICLDITNKTWYSIDITNGCFSNDRHIRLAVGRDYAHVAPVKGIRSGGGKEELITKVSIEKC